ncbi:MAG: hypothetical protein GF330_01645, partial [Candidatus Eisenbacteria bacterium]|nr:hypothetical protein [Candidatus Eisenbacteria bacterium]
AGGAEASRAVIAAVRAAAAAGRLQPEPDPLRQLSEVAHRAVLHKATERDLTGMGSTLTLVVGRGADIALLQVGDSRCYRIDPSTDRITQWSRDQNLAAELLANGTISMQEAERHPGRHILTDVMGGEKPPRPEIATGSPLAAGELLLICSDGLIRVLSDREIATQLTADRPSVRLQQHAERMLAEANERGSPDNVSIVLVRLTRSR